MTFLVVPGYAVQDSLNDILVCKLHELEELFAALEGKAIYDNRSIGKVAKEAPLIIHLVDSDALVRIIGVLSPILWVEVFNEWCYAIEVHAILSVL